MNKYYIFYLTLTLPKAKEFESRFSGFVPENERPRMQADIEKEQVLRIIQKTDKYIIPRKVCFQSIS